MPRPGLAQAQGEGRWGGLLVEVCRAIAAAAGRPGPVDFRAVTTPAEARGWFQQPGEVAFLSGRDIAVAGLAGRIVPGPTVFVVQDLAMVPAASPAQHLADLAGAGVCFMAGSTAEQGLEAAFERLGQPWLRHPFSERGEMEDAYAAGHCQAVAAEASELARIRLQPGQAALHSRLLPEPLTTFPLLAATAVADGARWAASVAWAVYTLAAASQPGNRWFAGGADAMPVAAPELGLGTGWQARMLKATGSLQSIFERNLGRGSRYGLPAGPNRPVDQGGLWLAPYVE
ncbi:MAG: hypothetical protein KGJ24_10730 [Burkholderiales bacterium]|nr:hypothetical protein [Burkholderiales bacterium]